jgi:hypothetical protein
MYGWRVTMAKKYTYEIERVTTGIDRYYVEFWDDEEPATDEAYAISLIEKGEIDVDMHEDMDWGEFRVTDRSVYDEEEDSGEDAV